MKKTILLIISGLIMFSGCATNFQTYTDWKEDKQGKELYAEVLESKIENDYHVGVAKIHRTGEIVNFVQKPYFKPINSFEKGTNIFIRVDEYNKAY